MSFAWNDANTDELKRLHGLGWSGRAIAGQLGTTKRAVNSKRHRIGLSRGIESVRETRRAEGKAKRHDSGRPVLLPPSEPKQPTTLDTNDPARTDGLRITDAGFGGCRWPIGGDGADTRFCCREATETYCAEHHARAYTRAMNPQELRGLKRLLRRAA